jgi:hypothetical protein
MQPQSIESIRKRFSDEWLLLRVDRVVHSKPLTGWLLEHSPDRTFIYKKISLHNSKYPVFVIYSQQKSAKQYTISYINA